MKKIIILSLILGFFLVGCEGNKEKKIIKEFTQKIEKSEGYNLTGELSIINNEETYEYLIETAFKKDNFFKVSMKNKVNNHEQLIYKNNDGVFVYTPSLNKSFKFQSDWPYNNSQIYILQTISKDLNQLENNNFRMENDNFIFTSKVNYLNNPEIVKQDVIFDKNNNLKEVIIYDNNNNIKMKMKFNKIDYKATYDENYFNISNTSSNVETTNKNLDSIVYPMYVPDNTKLSAQEKVSINNGERVILTFSGENPFTLIQETANCSKELMTIPIFGNPELVRDTIGAISENSVNWVSNGVEFYVMSDKLDNTKLLEVANSINVKAVGK